MGNATTTDQLNPNDSKSHNTKKDFNNYDYLSDQHNLIIGSIVLLLTLISLVVAFLTWRQGRRRLSYTTIAVSIASPSRVSSVDFGGDIELGTLGELASRSES